MSKAEYLAAFGVPMSAEDKTACEMRDGLITERWHSGLAPALIRDPSVWQRLRYAFVRAEDLPVPRDADLPPPALTTMGGMPLHRFKRLANGKVLYLGPTPSPGFPGS